MRHRPTALAAAVMAASAVLAAPIGAMAATLVVLNKSDATASLIDLDSGKVVATLPTGRGPHEAAVSADGRLALASNYGTNAEPGSTLTLIDIPAAKVVRTIELGEYRRPHGLRWIDNRRALVTAEAQKALLVVDTQKGTVEDAIVTGQEISHMVASADGKRAFVTNIGSGSITAIDLVAKKLLGHVPTGQGSEGIDVTPDGKQVWVTNRMADSVAVVDAASLKVVATIPSKSFPIRARVTPDGRTVLVTNARSGEVAAFDTTSFKELHRVSTGLSGTGDGRALSMGQSSAPIGIVVSPDGKRAYVAHANADVISILDLVKWEPAGTLKAGKEPDGMAYSSLSVKAAR